MNAKLLLASLCLVALAFTTCSAQGDDEVPEDCPKCDESKCTDPDEVEKGCPERLMKDRCQCCFACGQKLGEECGKDHGNCDPDFACSLQMRGGYPDENGKCVAFRRRRGANYIYGDSFDAGNYVRQRREEREEAYSPKPLD